MWVLVVQQGQQAIQVHLVLPVHVVQQEEVVHQERPDLVVLVDLPDLEELLDQEVTPVHVDLQGLVELQDSQVMLDHLGLLVPPGYQVHQGQQALRDLKAPLASLVLLEAQVRLKTT